MSSTRSDEDMFDSPDPSSFEFTKSSDESINAIRKPNDKLRDQRQCLLETSSYSLESEENDLESNNDNSKMEKGRGNISKSSAMDVDTNSAETDSELNDDISESGEYKEIDEENKSDNDSELEINGRGSKEDTMDDETNSAETDFEQNDDNSHISESGENENYLKELTDTSDDGSELEIRGIFPKQGEKMRQSRHDNASSSFDANDESSKSINDETNAIHGSKQSKRRNNIGNVRKHNNDKTNVSDSSREKGPQKNGKSSHGTHGRNQRSKTRQNLDSESNATNENSSVTSGNNTSDFEDNKQTSSQSECNNNSNSGSESSSIFSTRRPRPSRMRYNMNRESSEEEQRIEGPMATIRRMIADHSEQRAENERKIERKAQEEKEWRERFKLFCEQETKRLEELNKFPVKVELSLDRFAGDDVSFREGHSKF